MSHWNDTTTARMDSDSLKEMHLKMCKKIAQLTKVIFLLNTKNDEHDEYVAKLKQLHEREIEQIMTETKDKLESYEKHLGGETENKQKLQQMEKVVEEYEQQKTRFIAEFGQFRSDSERKRDALAQEYEDRIALLVKDVETTKQNFGETVKRLEARIAQKSGDTDQTLQTYAQELDELRRTGKEKSSRISDLERELGEVVQKCEALKDERAKLQQEFDEKTQKLQSFFEKELEAARSSKAGEYEKDALALRQQLDIAQRDLRQAQSDAERKQQSFVAQLLDAEEVRKRLEKECSKLKESVSTLTSDHSALQGKLQESLRTIESLKAQLEKEAGQNQRLAAELSAQSAEAKRTDASRLEETQRLERELALAEKERQNLLNESRELQQKLKRLQDDLRSTENNNSSKRDESSVRIGELERQLEQLRNDKANLVEQHANAMRKSDEQHESKLFDKINEYESRLSTLRAELESQRSLFEAKATECDCVRIELARMEHELGRIEMERERMRKEMEEERSRFDRDAGKLQKDLSGWRTELEQTRSSNGQLRVQLESAALETSELRKKLDKLQEELLSKQSDFDKRMKAFEADLLERTDARWSSELRKARQETEQACTDRFAEDTARLRAAHVNELTELRTRYESKLKELDSLLVSSRKKLSSEMESRLAKAEEARFALESELDRVRKEFTAAKDEYAERVGTLEKLHAERISHFDELKQRALRDLESQLREKLISEMNIQQLAHRTTVDALKEKHSKELRLETDKLKAKHSSELDNLRLTVREQVLAELESTRRALEQQLHAARNETDKVVELQRQKESQWQSRSDQISDDLRLKETRVANLENDLIRLQKANDDANKQLEERTREIQKLKSDFSSKQKKREDELNRQLNDRISQFEQDHEHEKDTLLTEFNKAQELLKAKIEDLQTLLAEAELQYARREPRNEDLRRIAELEAELEQKQLEIMRMQEEKRFYQLELVNRETNFNKVFNTNPNVGVINPLSLNKRKKNDKNNVLMVKADSTSTPHDEHTTITRVAALVQHPLSSPNSASSVSSVSLTPLAAPHNGMRPPFLPPAQTKKFLA